MLLITYERKVQPMRMAYRLFAATGLLGFANHPTIFELWYGPIRSLAPGVGGVLVALALVAGTGIFVWRTLAPWFRSEEAVRSEPDHVLVRTLWQTQRLRWSDIESIDIMGNSLVFRSRGRRIAVPLRATTMHRSRWQSMRDHLRELQAEALGGARATGLREVPLDAAPDSDFDPDAALARYLARKAAATATESQPAAAPAPLPVAPRAGGFGRKGL